MDPSMKQAILKNVCSSHGQITSRDATIVAKALFNPFAIVNVVVLFAIILIFTYTQLSSLIIVDGRICKIRLGIYSIITYVIVMLVAYYFFFDSLCKQ
jgi:hypothetical protein